jgi:hypothetical protein
MRVCYSALFSFLVGNWKQKKDTKEESVSNVKERIIQECLKQENWLLFKSVIKKQNI